MKLTIRFAGLCTHFHHGLVRGVPHRVVLPDATNFTTGFLTAPKTVPKPNLNQDPVLYYLLPHFAQLEVDDGERINVPPLVDNVPAVSNGDIQAGIRIQVVNAVNEEMKYKKHVAPKLTDYVSDYSFSSDVVLHGRAACYFDLYGGEVTTVTTQTKFGGATQTLVTLKTQGPPELLVTPIAPSGPKPRSFRLHLGSSNQSEVQLTVKNLEFLSAEHAVDHQGGAFDFLLHYLTARGGIPQSISKLTPGLLPKHLVSATKKDLANTLEKLAAALKHNVSNDLQRRLITPDAVTPSCSDSQYP